MRIAIKMHLQFVAIAAFGSFEFRVQFPVQLQLQLHLQFV